MILMLILAFTLSNSFYYLVMMGLLVLFLFVSKNLMIMIILLEFFSLMIMLSFMLMIHFSQLAPNWFLLIFLTLVSEAIVGLSTITAFTQQTLLMKNAFSF